VKYDYFAFIYNQHQGNIKNLLSEIVNDRKIKLQDKQKTLEEMWNTPIKCHLLFKVLEKGLHSSWKDILTEFYQRKLNDFNKKLVEVKELNSSILANHLKNFETINIKIIKFKLTLTSPFFTASENKFYSIQNPIAKERPTGLPIFKGSSLKGALRQAAVDVIEDELMERYFDKYSGKSEEEILKEENSKEREDRFFFKKRARIVKLFGKEKEAKWFTFKSLLATGGIKEVDKIEEVLKKITDAFENYLKKEEIVDKEGSCRGRLIFEDTYFTKVKLDVITPLDRKKRTPARGPIFYEVVPEGEKIEGQILWLPFDLIAKGKFDEIDKEWEKDKEILEKAFKKLSEKGIGAKTKSGWGRFKVESLNGA